MLELYAWTTPNGFKPLILLEELGIDFEVKAVNLGLGEQRAPEFLAINPNGKIPALRDGKTDVVLWESAAILTYLEETYGDGAFLPREEPARSRVLTWAYFQMSTVGPYLGQAWHFKSKDDEVYAKQRYLGEAERIFTLLDAQLEHRDYLAGDYSIADMLTYPWVYRPEGLGFDPARWPNLRTWIDRVSSRPAVQRAMAWRP